MRGLKESVNYTQVRTPDQRIANLESRLEMAQHTLLTREAVAHGRELTRLERNRINSARKRVEDLRKELGAWRKQ